LKPSPYTPLTTLKLGEILAAALPPGVANVIAGSDELGQAMTEHADIDKISFTGSVETGKKVYASAAGTMKRLTLELGGNDPAIILEDVEPKAIAKKVFFSSFVNSGQVCMAIKRIYAHESIYDGLCDALVEEAGRARVGNGLDPETTLGPLQNRMQYDKVCDLIAEVKASGAKILCGGEIPEGPGYFIPPTLVTDVAEDSRLVQGEQFTLRARSVLVWLDPEKYDSFLGVGDEDEERDLRKEEFDAPPEQEGRLLPLEAIQAIYADEDIRFEQGENIIRADRFYYDLVEDRALFLDGYVRSSIRHRRYKMPLYLRAAEIRQRTGSPSVASPSAGMRCIKSPDHSTISHAWSLM